MGLLEKIGLRPITASSTSAQLRDQAQESARHKEQARATARDLKGQRVEAVAAGDQARMLELRGAIRDAEDAAEEFAIAEADALAKAEIAARREHDDELVAEAAKAAAIRDRTIDHIKDCVAAFCAAMPAADQVRSDLAELKVINSRLAAEGRTDLVARLPLDEWTATARDAIVAEIGRRQREAGREINVDGLLSNLNGDRLRMPWADGLRVPGFGELSGVPMPAGALHWLQLALPELARPGRKHG